MLAYNDTLVTSALSHPRWCVTEHPTDSRDLHQSADIPVGEIGDAPVKVQRVQYDPEPSFPTVRDELVVSVGGRVIELPVDDASQLPQQFRNIAASLDLILGGA